MLNGEEYTTRQVTVSWRGKPEEVGQLVASLQAQYPQSYLEKVEMKFTSEEMGYLKCKVIGWASYKDKIKDKIIEEIQKNYPELEVTNAYAWLDWGSGTLPPCRLNVSVTLERKKRLELSWAVIARIAIQVLARIVPIIIGAVVAIIGTVIFTTLMLNATITVLEKVVRGAGEVVAEKPLGAIVLLLLIAVAGYYIISRRGGR